SRALQTCDDARARIDDARRQAIGRILVRQQPPVWRIGFASPGPSRGGVGLAGDLAAKIDNVRIYARAYWLRLVLSGLIVLAFVPLLGRGRPQRDGPAGHAGAPGRVPPVVTQPPVAAAILVGLLASPPLRPPPPFAFQQVMLVIATTAAVFVLRPVMDAR